MELFKIYSLFIITAIAEIVGCYLVYLWLKKDGSILLLVPASLSLIVLLFSLLYILMQQHEFMLLMVVFILASL